MVPWMRCSNFILLACLATSPKYLPRKILSNSSQVITSVSYTLFIDSHQKSALSTSIYAARPTLLSSGMSSPTRILLILLNQCSAASALSSPLKDGGCITMNLFIASIWLIVDLLVRLLLCEWPKSSWPWNLGRDSAGLIFPEIQDDGKLKLTWANPYLKRWMYLQNYLQTKINPLLNQN
ncbi:unnamed protein product, partial [Vitis vinifera]